MRSEFVLPVQVRIFLLKSKIVISQVTNYKFLSTLILLNIMFHAPMGRFQLELIQIVSIYQFDLKQQNETIFLRKCF